MKNKSKGSFTVEAALVLPIVLFVILAVIFLSFYLYDVCRIEGITDKILHQAAMRMKHESTLATGEIDYQNINDRGVFYLITGSTEEEEAEIEAYLWQELTTGLLCTEVTNIKVTAGKRKVTAAVEAESGVLIKGIWNYFRPKGFVYEIARPVHNPAESIRFSEVILETGSKIKGLDALQEQITNILK